MDREEQLGFRDRQDNGRPRQRDQQRHLWRADENGKATGYFYLSYYDKTISQPETMTFSPDLLDEANDFEVLQHDYMAAQGGFYTTPATADVTSSANVFETSQDLSIKAVSTRTSEENQRVTFAIYELRDGATEPTDGTLLYRTSRNFEYAGFHRLDLDWALEVKAGKKIAVVSTASTLDSDGTRLYSASANQAFSKQSVEFLNGMGVPVTVYGEAVVNEGESFLYSNGQWVDWSKHIAALPKSTEEVPIPGVTLPGDTYIEQFPIDNFSIKLYAVPAEITLTHQEAKAATCTEPGNIEYWYYDTSEGQRQYYKDKDGKEKIDLADTVIAPLGHKWGAWTELDGEQHQRVCERDSSHVEKAEHVWDEGEVTTEPTATKDGVRTHICKDCGATTVPPRPFWLAGLGLERRAGGAPRAQVSKRAEAVEVLVLPKGLTPKDHDATKAGLLAAPRASPTFRPLAPRRPPRPSSAPPAKAKRLVTLRIPSPTSPTRAASSTRPTFRS